MRPKLPSALFLCVAAALAASTAYATNYEVGLHTGSNNLPSSSSNCLTYTSDLTLSGTDQMGAFDANANLITSFGKLQYEKPLFGSYKQTSTGNVTKNVAVTGTLTLSDNAKVVLGGQYKDVTTLRTYDEYTGLIATNVVVNDSATLQSYTANLNNLTVNGGTVNIHTATPQGNTGMRLEAAKDSKQVQIKDTLNIHGGNVTIGRSGADTTDTDTHTVTAFGTLTVKNPTIISGTLVKADGYDLDGVAINQSAGKLTVAGKSLSVGGLNINQTGGTMAVSLGSYHFLSDYGDSVITQNGAADTTLSIGTIKAYNGYYRNVIENLIENNATAEINPSLNLTQDGAGTINLNGVYFTNQDSAAESTEISTITQNGTGTINLNKAYEGAAFSISQTGAGQINLTADASMTATSISQTGSGRLNVASEATLTAESVAISGSVTNAGLVAAESITVNNGTLTNNADIIVSTLKVNGGQVVNNGTISGVSTFSADSSATVITITEGGELVNNSIIEKDIVMDGGSYIAVDGSTMAGLTATGGVFEVQGDITVTGDIEMTNADFIFADGASIDLSGNEFAFTGGNIAITLTDTALEDFVGVETIFTNAGNVSGLDSVGATVTTADGEEVRVELSINADGSVTTILVPEPATATLSLLALTAMAARRRRH